MLKVGGELAYRRFGTFQFLGCPASDEGVLQFVHVIGLIITAWWLRLHFLDTSGVAAAQENIFESQ